MHICRRKGGSKYILAEVKAVNKKASTYHLQVSKRYSVVTGDLKDPSTSVHACVLCYLKQTAVTVYLIIILKDHGAAMARGN
jgi:hypothetical protein